MANPIAVPGTNVPSGAAVSPGGAQGVTGTAGAPAWTTCTSPFTIPAVGSTVSAPVVDTSWITVGEMLYVDQAGGGVGLSGILQVTAKTSNSLTLLNPTPAPAIPPADATQAGLLKQLSGNTTDFVDGTNTCQNLVTAVQPTITAVRLRSFNAVGNPTFEIDQRNVGNSLTNPSSGSFILDRWSYGKVGTMTVNSGQITGYVPLPGTSFNISQKYLRFTLTTQEASLASGDLLAFYHAVEGPLWRELASDVTSISLLVRTSVTNLSFSLVLRDGNTAVSLVKLCTVPTANVWTLLPLPNIPVPSSGTFNSAAGAAAYYLSISLAAGSSFTAPAANTWQTGNFQAASGMSNFAASPVNSTFDLAFVQHEPGAQCSTPMDKPFTQNYDDCLRYFQKTYSYGVAVGAGGGAGSVSGVALGGNWPQIFAPFKRPMAKVPTIIGYSTAAGAANNVRDVTASLDRAISGGGNLASDSGFAGFQTATTNAANALYQFHYTADTGW